MEWLLMGISLLLNKHSEKLKTMWDPLSIGSGLFLLFDKIWKIILTLWNHSRVQLNSKVVNWVSYTHLRLSNESCHLTILGSIIPISKLMMFKIRHGKQQDQEVLWMIRDKKDFRNKTKVRIYKQYYNQIWLRLQKRE